MHQDYQVNPAQEGLPQQFYGPMEKMLLKPERYTLICSARITFRYNRSEGMR